MGTLELGRSQEPELKLPSCFRERFLRKGENRGFSSAISEADRIHVMVWARKDTLPLGSFRPSYVATVLAGAKPRLELKCWSLGFWLKGTRRAAGPGLPSLPVRCQVNSQKKEEVLKSQEVFNLFGSQATHCALFLWGLSRLVR